MDTFESLNHSVWQCKYYVVFIPKCRRMLIAIPPKYAVAQVVGFIKGKSAIHLARVCEEVCHRPWLSLTLPQATTADRHFCGPVSLDRCGAALQTKFASSSVLPVPL
jgi:REP element-mobilizing transposase RayT